MDFFRELFRILAFDLLTLYSNFLLPFVILTKFDLLDVEN